MQHNHSKESQLAKDSHTPDPARPRTDAEEVADIVGDAVGGPDDRQEFDGVDAADAAEASSLDADERPEEAVDAQTASPKAKRRGFLLKHVRLTVEEHEQLQRQAAEAAEARDRALRMAAELDNARRRLEKDRETFIRLATEEVVRRLLPVVDDVERAVKTARDAGVEAKLVTGLELVEKNLREALQASGLERLKTVGERFDPLRHEAVAQMESAEHPEQTVVEECRAGYAIRGHVVRPAMVKVSVPPADDAMDRKS